MIRTRNTAFVLAIVLLFLLPATGVWGEPLQKKIQLQHALFYSQKEVLVRYDQPGPHPYERFEYDYYIGSGVQLKNLTSQKIERLKVTCRFKDNWNRDLSVRTAMVDLNPGESRRVIFHSGLLAENITGPQVTISNITQVLIMNPEQEEDFLNFGLNPDFDRFRTLNTTVRRTITKVTCDIQLEASPGDH